VSDLLLYSERPTLSGVVNSACTQCYALIRMRPLSISCADGCVVISRGKVAYDKSGWRDGCVRITVRLSFIMSERMIDATSILARELEAPPVYRCVIAQLTVRE
jgi:hypothetical protein